MPKLSWNNIGERRFEAGVDRGVFYTSDGVGVAWNGLVGVKETSSGGDPKPYYLDGVKYLNVAGHKEFTGTINAFTYPDEFTSYDGWVDNGNGLMLDEQARKPFGLSYRTQIGNDTVGNDLGYKIHVIYNVMASPSDVARSTLIDTIDPLTFSWNFTTTPVKPVVNTGIRPLAHLVIDSTKTNPTQLQFIEDYLYGSGERTSITGSYMVVDPGQSARLPSIDQFLAWDADPIITWNLLRNEVTGMSELVQSPTITGDLVGPASSGLYTIGSSATLIPSGTPGLNA